MLVDQIVNLTWTQEAARWKKDRRELGTLAAAHAIIDGDSTTSEAALRAAALAAAAPVVPTFRVLATVLELRALMQQGVHESGLYHAYILKWKLAGLEQQDKVRAGQRSDLNVVTRVEHVVPETRFGIGRSHRVRSQETVSLG